MVNAIYRKTIKRLTKNFGVNHLFAYSRINITVYIIPNILILISLNINFLNNCYNCILWLLLFLFFGRGGVQRNSKFSGIDNLFECCCGVCNWTRNLYIRIILEIKFMLVKLNWFTAPNLYPSVHNSDSKHRM